MSSGIPPGAFDPIPPRSELPPDAFAPLRTPVREDKPKPPDPDIERLLRMLGPEESARVKNAAILSRVTGFDQPTASAFEAQLRGAEKPQRLLEYWSEGIATGIAAGKVGELGYKQFFGDNSAETQAAIDEQRKAMKPEGQQWQKWHWARPIRWALEMGPNMLAGLTEGAAKGAALGGAAALAGLPMEAAPGPGTVGHAATVAGAAGIGFAEGTLESIFRKETGLAYVEFGDVRDANGDALSPTARRVAAGAAGVIKTALEVLQVGKLFPGLKRKVMGVATDAIKRGLLSAVGDVSTQSFQEMLQETTDVLAGEIAAGLQGALGGAEGAGAGVLANLKAAIPRVLETGLRAIGSFGVMTGARALGRVAIGAERPGIPQQDVSREVEAPEAEPVASEAAPIPTETFYHGTTAPTFGEFREGNFYLTASKDEATEFAGNPLAAGHAEGQGGRARAIEIAAKPGKVRDIGAEIDEALFEDDFDPDKVIQDMRPELDAEGVRYVEFDHPSLTGDEMMKVRVSLYPKEDLQIASDPAVPTVQKTPAAEPAPGAPFIAKSYVQERTEYMQALAEARNLKVADLLDSMDESYGTGARELQQAMAYGRREGEANGPKARAEVAHEFSVMRKDLKEALAETERMSPAHAEPIRELLSGLDLVVKRQPKTLASLEATAAYLKDNPEADLPREVTDRLAILSKRPLGDMTMDEIREVHDAVMHHAALESKKQEIRVKLSKMRKEAAVKQAVAEMKPAEETSIETPFAGPTLGERISKPFVLARQQVGLRSTHYDLIVEEIAGPNSVVDKVFNRAIEEGRRTKETYRQRVLDAFRADLEASGVRKNNLEKWLGERVGTGRLVGLTRDERMALYRHTFDDDNLASILEKGVSRPGKKPVSLSVEELQELLDGMSDDEKRFAGAPVSNLFREQGKALGEVYYRTHGYPLPLRENYMPKEVNPLSRDVEPETQEAIDMFKDRFARVGIEKGMLIKRTEAKKPLILRPLTEVLNRSVDRASTYIGFEEPLVEASKLLYDKTFRSELDTRYGPEVRREIEKGLRDIVGGGAKDYSSLESFFLRARSNMTKAMLSLNPFSAAKVVFSFPLFGVYVKPKYMAQGLMQYDANRKAVVQSHMDWSPGYRSRVEEGGTRDVAEVQKKRGAAKRLTQAKEAVGGMAMIRFMDRHTVAAGMQGAVLQALDEFQAGELSREVATALDMKNEDIAKLTPREKMEKAYRFADYVVERTQDTSAPEHMSPMARGNAFEKLFTQFTTSTNQMFNLLKRSYDDASRTGNYKKAALATLAVSIAVMGDAVIDGLRDEIYRRKNRKTFWSRTFQSAAGMVYGLGDIMRAASSIMGKGPPQEVQLAPSRMMTLASKLLGNVGKATIGGNRKAASELFDNLLEGAAITWGLPYYGPRAMYRAATGR